MLLTDRIVVALLLILLLIAALRGSLRFVDVEAWLVALCRLAQRILLWMIDHSMFHVNAVRILFDWQMLLFAIRLALIFAVADRTVLLGWFATGQGLVPIMISRAKNKSIEESHVTTSIIVDGLDRTARLLAVLRAPPALRWRAQRFVGCPPQSRGRGGDHIHALLGGEFESLEGYYLLERFAHTDLAVCRHCCCLECFLYFI